MKTKSLKVSIVGASGYGGGELLRILLGHPNVTVQQATSRKYKRFPVTILHPNLRSITKLKFSDPEKLKKCDVLFLSMPNGISQKNIDYYLSLAPYIVDLGADFRLETEADYNKWYGKHLRPELLSIFTCGIAEINRTNIKKAKRIACSGCEATCSILTLYPLYKYRLIHTKQTIVDAKIGSSASGSRASSASHHPERSGSVRSYKLTMHRHTAEIEQVMRSFAKDVRIGISATAIPMVRGILITCQTFLKDGVTLVDVQKAYNHTYKDKKFIRIVRDKIGNYRFPEPKILSGTNFCDIGFEKDARSNRLVVVGAIDNLVKGTAGQAVQAMNIMLGIDEASGLSFSGLHPV